MELESDKNPVLRELDHFQVCLLKLVPEGQRQIFGRDRDTLSVRLDEVILNVLKEKNDTDILEFRDKHIYNLENSSEMIAGYLIQNSSL